MSKHTSHTNKARIANANFQSLLADFQKSNAKLIAGNISPPKNTEAAVKSINKNVKTNTSTQTKKKQIARSMAAKANSARIANTPEIKQAVLSSPNLFNLGF